jgi:endonuclease YncB( thermonuclease family)
VKVGHGREKLAFFCGKNYTKFVTPKFLRILLATSLIINGVLLFRNYERMRVVEVLDGDTVRIKSGDRIRLEGFDAPEKEVCGFEEAKKELEEWILDEVITIRKERKDYWGRRLGKVYLGDVLINEEMKSFVENSPKLVNCR